MSFFILSLDGGGYRGIYSAYVLKRIEEEINLKWNIKFNLITGTSTGSIIAAGLSIGLSAIDIYNFYLEHGRKIFKKSFFSKGFFKSQYNNQYLKSALKDIYKNIKLGDITTPLIIPSTDIGNGKVHVFKSSYDKEFVRDKNRFLYDAVLASCSAPTYFNPYLVNEYLLSDGGLWANNPSLVAVIDAKKRFGINMNDIKIVSIGTGISKTFYSQKECLINNFLGWGFLTRWGGSKFIDMLLNLQAETSNNMLGLLLKPEQIYRINFESDKKLSIDNTKFTKDWLAKADYDYTHQSEKIKNFLK